LDYEIKFAFSLIWRHSNYRLIFSRGWEWLDNVSDDLQDGFGDFLQEQESGTDPKILEELELPNNWTMLSSGNSAYSWKYTEFEELKKNDLVQLLPARHNWNDDYGACTYIVPLDFEVSKWESLSREEKLLEMDQLEYSQLENVDDFSGFNNEGYFDFYVIGQVEAVAVVNAENLEVAQVVFLNQFNEYAEKVLPAALTSLMPDPEFLEKVDEKVTLVHVPNWLYVEKQQSRPIEK
jgi:hypothetical protein